MARKNRDVDDWGFDDTGKDKFDWAEYQASVKRYNAPITKHVCDRACEGQFKLPLYHEREEVFDDFELSQGAREKIRMLIPAVQGRDIKERLMIRRFVSTRTGNYIIRLEEPDVSFNRICEDIEFDTEEEQIEYFNYCVKTFSFKTVELIGDTDESFFENEDEGWGFEDEWDNF